MDRNVRRGCCLIGCSVALRKESVDRNRCKGQLLGDQVLVALRKESVDRNVVVVHDLIKCTGRSPQGERG